MCGIAGIYNLDGEPVARREIVRMTDAIAHRGPDGEGQFVDGEIGLGHRRLAVLDPTPAGAQPMTCPSGDLVLTYNGEIYNFEALRAELQAAGHRFHSRTDTEVLLHAYAEWGEACLDRLNGMFAFAIWDRRRRRLFLARDRYGIKPLYYTHRGGLFAFASEIKALLTYPEIGVRVCPFALNEYFTFQNIFSDRTLFDGIHLLPGGCHMTVAADRAPAVVQTRYWDYRFSAEGFEATEEKTAEELYHLLRQAVTRQLVSDVPVGAYLSGGMDSGSITAVAAHHIPRIRTFTGGFDLSSASGLELGFDERAASEIMANTFKTEHYEMVMHAGDMEHVMPELIWHLEDLRVGQCYPNYYVARLAGKFVKVVLSGTGGDELFAGYPWRYYRGLEPDSPDGYHRTYYEYWQRLLTDQERACFFNDEVSRASAGHDPIDDFRQVLDGADTALDTIEGRINASLYFEIKTFLHGLFVVEDKLSMAHSLESRVPFMDNDLVDFALRIPPRFKLRDLERAPAIDEDEAGKKVRYQHEPTVDGKVVLRYAMQRLIPESIAQRAKQGFSAPDASWFRGESIDYVNRLLRNRKSRIFEFVQFPFVERMLDEHTRGQVNHRLFIWSLLSFEWWLRKFAD